MRRKNVSEPSHNTRQGITHLLICGICNYKMEPFKTLLSRWQCLAPFLNSLDRSKYFEKRILIQCWHSTTRLVFKAGFAVFKLFSPIFTNCFYLLLWHHYPLVNLCGCRQENVLLRTRTRSLPLCYCYISIVVQHLNKQ